MTSLLRSGSRSSSDENNSRFPSDVPRFDENNEHPLDTWCERYGVVVTAWHWRVVGVCSLGVASEASELLCLGYVLPILEFGGNLVSDIEKGHISAAAFAGMMVGGLGVGFMSDRHGRKPWLIVCSAIAAASGFAGENV